MNLRLLIATLFTRQPEPTGRIRFRNLDDCRAHVLRRDAERASARAKRGWDTRRAGR
jgi:hypothetical protein